MLTEVLTQEQAELELGQWLDKRRVTARKRGADGYKQAIDTLMDALVMGDIAMNEDGTIQHKLINPLEGFAEGLTYKTRIQVGDIDKIMKGTGGKDGSDRVLATISALTGVATGLLSKLTTEDNSIAQAVAIFFL